MGGGFHLEQGAISIRQFSMLTVLFVVGDTILYIPANVAADAQQSAWLSGILAMAAGLSIVALYVALAKRFPRMTPIEMGDRVLGAWLGKSIGVMFVTFFLIDTAVILWQVGDFMVTHMMPETPIQSFLILFILVVVMGYRLGVGTVARSAEILIFWVVALYVMLALLLTPQIETNRLLPFLDKGLNPVMRGALPLLGYYFEAVILLMVVPAVRGNRRLARAFLLGMAGGSFILSITVLLSILVLGTDLTELQIFTTYVLAKKINIADFLQRIEVIVASIWFITLFFKLYVCYYATVEGTAQLMKLKSGKALSLPFAVIIVAASLVFVPDSAYMNDLILNMWPAFSGTFGLAIPLLFIAASLFKKKRETRE